VSDMQLTVATESQLEDEGLLQLVQDLAREDFALCGEGASFTRRIRYDRMMRGQLRVYVPLPFFVDIRAYSGMSHPVTARRYDASGVDRPAWAGPKKTKCRPSKARRVGDATACRSSGGYSIYRSLLFRPYFVV